MPKKINIYYNRTNTCDKIKEDGKKCENELNAGNANREYDKKGNWTGKWLCNKCWLKFDYHKRLDTHHNLIKSVGDRRTGNLNPNSSCAKGDLFEQLTCMWRGVKNLNVENDNYKFSIDHSKDAEFGLIQTKGRMLGIKDGKYEYWSFKFEREWKKNIDNIICYCADKDGKFIERIYIFPKDEIIKRTGIAIYKNPNIWPPWYEKYRVKDEYVLSKVNEIFRSLLKNNKR